MIKSYLKVKKGLWRRYKNFPAFITKATKGIKKKIGKKMHGVKFSLVNEIPNIHIFFENVIFAKFGWNP